MITFFYNFSAKKRVQNEQRSRVVEMNKSFAEYSNTLLNRAVRRKYLIIGNKNQAWQGVGRTIRNIQII